MNSPVRRHPPSPTNRWYLAGGIRCHAPEPQAEAIGRAVESAKKNGISIDIVIVK
jgi:hypothetical protein